MHDPSPPSLLLTRTAPQQWCVRLPRRNGVTRLLHHQFTSRPIYARTSKKGAK